MKEVSPDIFLIKEKGAIKLRKPLVNIYIIAGETDGLIFDAGYGDKKTIKYVLEEIEKIREFYKSQNKDFRLTRILPSHTHPDHFSGLILLKKFLNLDIILTEKMAEVIKNKKTYRQFREPDPLNDLYIVQTFMGRFNSKIKDFFHWFFYKWAFGIKFLDNPDKLIENNTEISINKEQWNVIHLPGHAVDHISLYNEKRGVLLSGDNVIKNVTTWLGPPNSNIQSYLNSLELKVNNLPNLKLILPAHGRPIKNPIRRVKEIISHRKERTQQMIQIISNHREKGITPSQIIQILYPQGAKIINRIGRGWVCLTLKMLEENNLVRHIQTKRKIIFYPTNKI